MDINKFDWTEGLENKAIFSNDKVLIFKMKKSKVCPKVLNLVSKIRISIKC